MSLFPAATAGQEKDMNRRPIPLEFTSSSIEAAVSLLEPLPRIEGDER